MTFMFTFQASEKTDFAVLYPVLTTAILYKIIEGAHLVTICIYINVYDNPNYNVFFLHTTQKPTQNE